MAAEPGQGAEQFAAFEPSVIRRGAPKLGLAVVDDRGVVTFANDSICVMFDKEVSGVLGRMAGVFVGGESIPTNLSHFDDVIRTIEAAGGERRRVRLHFESIWLGAATCVLIAATDVTNSEQVSHDASSVDDLLDTVLGLSSEAVLAIDSDGTVRAASDSCMSIFGWGRSELIGSNISVLMRAEDSAAHQSAISRRLKSAAPIPLEESHNLVGLRRDGTSVPFQLRVADCPASLESRYLGFITDRSEVEALQSELVHAESMDPLTDLMTRSEFNKAAQRFLAEQSESMSLVIFDVVAFHNVNLIHGYGVGDQLLRWAAREIEACVASGPVARLGGDRFACLVETSDVHEFVKNVRVKVGSRRRTRGISHPLKLSVGVANAANGDSFEHLLGSADMAVRSAKASFGRHTVVFDDALGHHMERQARLSRDLHACIANRELLTYFQPEIDLADGSVAGHEALVRWNHPQLGMIGPDDFLPLATAEGLMPALGLQVVSASFDFIRKSDLLGYRGRVWVNLSAGQLYDDSVLGLTSAAIDSGIDPSRIGFELTEQVAASVESGAHDHFVRIGELGVALAIDDFGTGYSTLSELRSLPAQLVKLDRSFLSDIEHDPDQREFVAACVDLAHRLGKTVLAEGIETEDVADIVRSLGCDQAQGYLFGLPAPAEEALAALESRS